MNWLNERNWKKKVELVTVGTVVGWLGAKVVKDLVGRGRPDALVAGVEFAFGASIGGLGFPSGHVVVAFTIAVVFSPYLVRPARWALYGVAGVVALARVHTGAHMPLDVIGGVGLGLALGSLVCLLAGVVVAKARPGSLALDWVGTD